MSREFKEYRRGETIVWRDLSAATQQTFRLRHIDDFLGVHIESEEGRMRRLIMPKAWVRREEQMVKLRGLFFIDEGGRVTTWETKARQSVVWVVFDETKASENLPLSREDRKEKPE